MSTRMLSDGAKLGYTCKCGAFHAAGPWGAAHWTETLVHTCDACGRENTIRNGRVLAGKKPKVPKCSN